MKTMNSFRSPERLADMAQLANWCQTTGPELGADLVALALLHSLLNQSPDALGRCAHLPPDLSAWFYESLELRPVL